MPATHYTHLFGGIPTPLKNISSFVGMMIFPNEWKTKLMVQTTNQNNHLQTTMNHTMNHQEALATALLYQRDWIGLDKSISLMMFASHAAQSTHCHDTNLCIRHWIVCIVI